MKLTPKRKLVNLQEESNLGSILQYTQQIDSSQIAACAITTPAIASCAVVTNSIAAASITNALIAANAVIAGKIAANAVTSNTIAANAVIAGKIAANAVTTNTIAANAIIGSKILANVIGASHLVACAVTSDKIAANAVIASKISVANLSALSADLGTVTAGSITGVTISQANSTVILNNDGLSLTAGNVKVTNYVSIGTQGVENMCGYIWSYFFGSLSTLYGNDIWSGTEANWVKVAGANVGYFELIKPKLTGNFDANSKDITGIASCEADDYSVAGNAGISYSGAINTLTIENGIVTGYT
jgi:hypothetical protein